MPCPAFRRFVNASLVAGEPLWDGRRLHFLRGLDYAMHLTRRSTQRRESRSDLLRGNAASAADVDSPVPLFPLASDMLPTTETPREPFAERLM
jgi:hypothetical protein